MKVSALAVDSVKNEITIVMAEEPPDLNSMRTTDQVSIFVLGHILEGLTRYNQEGQIAPAAAERWEINEKRAKFFLRKAAKWSDGRPLTAHDFVFSWRTALDPKTASQYAFILYAIKNAEAINGGKMKLEDLGAKALDDNTLEVQFEKPCGYFLGLTAFPTYFPAREDFYMKMGEKYAADADKFLFNGPFKLVRWTHGAFLRLEKNQQYWNRSAVSLNAIDIPYVNSDVTVWFELFRNGKIALATLDSETLKSAQRDNYPFKKFSDGSIFYLEFNHRSGRFTANKNLRKALQLAFNPKEMVEKVIAVPGNVPAYSLFPKWLAGIHGKFRDEFKVEPRAVAIERAQKVLAIARKELGGKIPPLVLLTGDSSRASREAEYLQNLYRTRLGLEIRIDKQTFKQRLAKMTSGEFDIVAAGWGPDFNDPMTFADLFSSWNENNRGKYSNTEYDKLVRLAQGTTDQKVRMEAMGKIQDIVNEEVVVLPEYERGLVYLQSPQLKDVLRSVVGTDPNYIYAKIVK